jgi:hypothetical protein
MKITKKNYQNILIKNTTKNEAINEISNKIIPAIFS